MKINLEKFILKCFIFLFLFSNVLTRILNINFNLLFYIIAFILIVCSLRYINLIFMKEYFCIYIFFLLLCTFNFNTSLKYNLGAIKDIIFPITMLLCSELFIKYDKICINNLNRLYIIFIGYGIFQEYCFYTHKLSKFLPWDYGVIQDMLAKNISSNMFQPGGLLRFWGCMNAFAEYQITAVFLLLLLYFYKKYIINNKLFLLNFIMLILYLILSIERSPIMMLLITLIVWKQEKIKNNISIILKMGIFIIIFYVIALNCGDLLKDNAQVYGSYIRFKNVITFNLKKDTAVKDRESVEWKQDMKVIRNPKTFCGLGPATVSPSANKYKKYIGPHNNFLGWYIGYGFLGLILFLILILKVTKCFFKMKNYYKFFGIGVMLSFCMMATFNMPFMSKSGIIFFIIIGILCNDKKSYNKQFGDEHNETSISKTRTSIYRRYTITDSFR